MHSLGLLTLTELWQKAYDLRVFIPFLYTCTHTILACTFTLRFILTFTLAVTPTLFICFSTILSTWGLRSTSQSTWGMCVDGGGVVAEYAWQHLAFV